MKMGKVVNVIIGLDNNVEYNGKINIVDFKRFSDFIEKNKENNIKLFDVKSSKITGVSKKFLIIPKAKICFYEPFDEKRSLKNYE